VSDPAGWLLEEFLPRLYVWAEDEFADDDLINVVREWVFTRIDDPYRNAKRSEVAENLWFAQIPRSYRGGRVVTCSFWIYENTRIVSCDGFTSLSVPI
jgi:hypothetical protein